MTMRLVVILLIITLVNAVPQSQLHQQEKENNQHLNPINDAAAQEEAAKLQKKRTLFGPTILGQTRHVGIHPLGFKYILGYGPIGYYPHAKPITLLKPVLHSSGWKPIIPTANVPIFKAIKPILPVAPVKPHFHIQTIQPAVVPEQPVEPVHTVQSVVPIEKPVVHEPVYPVTPVVKHIQPQLPVAYPFYKPLFNPLINQHVHFQHPYFSQPPVIQPVVPHTHVVQPLVPQPNVVQHVVPQHFVPQPQAVHPIIPQVPVPQPVVPQLPPALFHIVKQFPQLPITPLYPVNHPVQHPVAQVPELSHAPVPPVTLHYPEHTQDNGVSVQIPNNLPENPHFPQNTLFNPETDQNFHGHFPQPNFHTEQHGHADHPFLIPQPQVPTHPAPQTPLYLPPHPNYRPGLANPVGPIEPTNSVHTEFSATFPKHPLVSGFQHPSISLEPPYGPAHLGINKH